MPTDDDKQRTEEGSEEPFERLKAIEKRIAKLEATLLSEFRRGNSPDDLREQSRAAVLRVNEVELKNPYRPDKTIKGR